MRSLETEDASIPGGSGRRGLAAVRAACARTTPTVRYAIKGALPSPAPRRIHVGLARGVTMNIDFRFQTRAYCGLYELELNRHFRELCTPGTCAFDVGAQSGYDALILAKLGGGPVASFEADPGCLQAMTQNFALNPALAPAITPVIAFIGTGADGTLSLDSYAGSASGFLPDFVKIDVDTAEVDVLEGARALLKDQRPHMLVEVHSEDLERRCGALLAEYGYKPTIVNQRRVLRDYRPTAHNRWLVAAGTSYLPRK